MTYVYTFPLLFGGKDLGYFKFESKAPVPTDQLDKHSADTLTLLRSAWGDEVTIGAPICKTFKK